MHRSAREAALHSGLALMCPDPAESRLLRAALLPGEAGRLALREVAPLLERPQALGARERVAFRTLAPLLDAAVARHEVPIAAEARRILRMAGARERARAAMVRRIGWQLMAQLARRNVDAVLLRGMALAETAYGEPHFRHTHDVDLLVPTGGFAAAEDAAREAGFTERSDDPGRLPDGIRLVHPSGLPVEIHHALFLSDFHPAELEGMRSRLEPVVALGVSALALNPADGLLHILGHAALSPFRGNLRWAVDAWLLMDRRRDLDWDAFLAAAIAGRLALPVSVLLRFLADELHAPVPARVLDTLALEARTVPAVARDVALYGARAGLPAFALVRRVEGWRPRLLALGWLVFPSPSYLRLVYRTVAVPTPLLYPYRIWRQATLAARNRWHRLRLPGSLEAEIA
ncbi:MAG TPA: nucleotidyltransferase family protein [Gemmatimonadales bacterium]